MYYLQSRYYDPFIGRFISADSFATTDADGILSCNVFAYCENNPVNRADPTGNIVTSLILSALIGGTVFAAAGFLAAKAVGVDYTIDDALIAFASGALTYAGLPLVGAMIAGGYSYVNFREGGVSQRNSIIGGIAITALTYFAVGNLATFADKTLLEAVEHGALPKGLPYVVAADGIFGVGVGMSASAISKALLMESRLTPRTPASNSANSYTMFFSNSGQNGLQTCHTTGGGRHVV